MPFLNCSHRTIIYGKNNLGQMVVLFVAMETIFNNINAIVSQLCDLMQNTFLSNDLYLQRRKHLNRNNNKQRQNHFGINLRQIGQYHNKWGKRYKEGRNKHHCYSYCTAISFFCLVQFFAVICIIKNGEICEMGSHKSLMEQRGIYYKMYTTQQSMYEDDVLSSAT